jgi:release factor glutamine methyltransferase
MSPHPTVGSDAALGRGALLAQARETLERSGVPAPAHDAECLLLHALAVPRTGLWSDRNAPVSGEAAARFARLLEARSRRVPLQHLLGEIPFHAAELDVEPGVFIPRPETERLVEVVLEHLGAELGECVASGTIVDLGTGTGAIPIALLLALPVGWTAAAIDRSEAAITLASRNARRNGVEQRLHLRLADFRDPPPPGIACPADVVVSNPPYVPTGSIPGLMPEVRDHDPVSALDGGPDGLDAFRAVAGGIQGWLKPGGLLALEIGADQADQCMELFRPHLTGARIASDLAGMPRILTGRRRGSRR